jgi:hypothetical protein
MNYGILDIFSVSEVGMLIEINLDPQSNGQTVGSALIAAGLTNHRYYYMIEIIRGEIDPCLLETLRDIPGVRSLTESDGGDLSFSSAPLYPPTVCGPEISDITVDLSQHDLDDHDRELATIAERPRALPDGDRLSD